MTAFLLAALLLGALILSVAFAPLFRARRVGGLGLVAGALAATGALYLLVGTPAALDPARRKAPDTLAAAVARLEHDLASNPKQPEGWQLLAQAYRAQQRLPDAANALTQAARYAPGDAEILAQAAEARALAAAGHQFDAQSVAMLVHALALHPEHQRARWFLGVAQRQSGHAAEAAHTWEPLLATVAPTTAVALRQQVDAARSDAGLPPLPASATQPAAQLTLDVAVTPTLRATLPADAAVFVIAREPGGSPMPVAVRRLALAQLPVRVQLTDSDSPMPTRALGQLATVEVIARISLHGVANAQPGDLESMPEQLARGGAAKLLIDHARK